ncbi:MAG TPA: MFS transporter [Acidobacteriota bacterium]|nr:MFS transporter [Acidobacteriota bacterium]
MSASAVVPALTAEWDLGAGERAWLTVSVQLGFVVGALGLAITNVADRVAAHRLFQFGAVLGAALNATIPLIEPGLFVVLVLRGATGACLAGVYPPAMKLMASWFEGRRGLAIGTLVGATTIGTALPHLFTVLPLSTSPDGLPPWRAVMLAASGSAVVAAAIVARTVRPGPHLPPATRFDWRQAARSLRDPASQLRLPRPHVGAVRHVGVGADPAPRELPRRWLRRAAGTRRRIRCDRGGRSRLGACRCPGRSGWPDRHYERRHGGVCRLCPAGGLARSVAAVVDRGVLGLGLHRGCRQRPVQCSSQ